MRRGGLADATPALTDAAIEATSYPAPVPWPPRARPGEHNHGWVDRFTAVHAAIGAGYAHFGLDLWSTLALAVAWELVENPLKALLPRLFPRATMDTLRNAVGDVLAVLLGWSLVAHAFGS